MTPSEMLPLGCLCRTCEFSRVMLTQIRSMPDNSGFVLRVNCAFLSMERVGSVTSLVDPATVSGPVPLESTSAQEIVEQCDSYMLCTWRPQTSP